MNRIKKKMAVVLSVMIMVNCAVTQEAKASWISDFFGGIFTVLTYPLQMFCPDNPTFRKNNPFRKKAWEEVDEIPHEEEKRFERLYGRRLSDLEKRQQEIEKQIETEKEEQQRDIDSFKKSVTEIINNLINDLFENYKNKIKLMFSSYKAYKESAEEFATKEEVKKQEEFVQSIVLSIKFIFANQDRIVSYLNEKEGARLKAQIEKLNRKRVPNLFSEGVGELVKWLFVKWLEDSTTGKLATIFVKTLIKNGFSIYEENDCWNLLPYLSTGVNFTNFTIDPVNVDDLKAIMP